MRFLFYFSHPAQYLSMRETIRRLLAKPDNHATVLIRTKDVLEDLIKHDGIPYTNFLPRQRGTSRLAMALSLLKRVLLLPIIWKKKTDLLIGTDAALAQVGKLLAINRITILEDDYAVVENLATLTGILSEQYRRYQHRIHPADVHSVLANATLLVSDGQSMSVEAAVLGVPSIRHGDLVGRISVLNELESRYRLTIGILISQREQLLPVIRELLTTERVLAVYQARRQHMLRDKIDVTSFWVDFFENYEVGIKFKPTNRPLATGTNP